MKLKAYFENVKGVGVLSTANDGGRVNAAIYAKPHFLEDGTLAFIMRDRLTHANINSNPHAAYLFHEKDAGYQGKRLYLRKIREEKESPLLYQLKRRENKTIQGWRRVTLSGLLRVGKRAASYQPFRRQCLIGYEA